MRLLIDFFLLYRHRIGIIKCWSFGFVKNVEIGEKILIEVEIVSSNPDVANELRTDIKRVMGSNEYSLATLMGLPFVQEVIAETRTVQAKNPEAYVIIELGGDYEVERASCRERV